MVLSRGWGVEGKAERTVKFPAGTKNSELDWTKNMFLPHASTQLVLILPLVCQRRSLDLFYAGPSSIQASDSCCVAQTEWRVKLNTQIGQTSPLASQVIVPALSGLQMRPRNLKSLVELTSPNAETFVGERCLLLLSVILASSLSTRPKTTSSIQPLSPFPSLNPSPHIGLPRLWRIASCAPC